MSRSAFRACCSIWPPTALMNVAAFGVLIFCPADINQPATSAETFEDIAGTGPKAHRSRTWPWPSAASASSAFR